REAKLACWLERAAEHQCRALRWLQELRGPGRVVLSSAETGTRQYRALQSLLAARRAVLRAEPLARGSARGSTLQGHLAQLDALIQAVEQECSETEAQRV